MAFVSHNQDIAAAWAYHDGTKHSFDSVRHSAHMLDFTNQPRPWKLYQDDLPFVQLSPSLLSSGVAALDAISTAAAPSPEPLVPSLEQLTAVLLLSAGVTKQLPMRGGRMAFRAAACTGALYHIELYVVCQDLDGLSAGVYQFSVHDNRLRRLREGDHRATVAAATGGDEAVAQAPVIIAYTSTFWRNAWKYQSRAYRHAYWDSGTILANALSAANAHGLPAKAVAGFVDDEVNALLDVDAETEAAVALLPLGQTDAPLPEAPSVERLHLPVVPPSRREIDYPAIREMHVASSLVSPGEAAAWRERLAGLPGPPAPDTGLVAVASGQDTQTKPLEEVIIKRGSSRRFEQESISYAQLSTVLARAAGPVPLDGAPESMPLLVTPYVIANDVDGLEPDAYVYHRGRQHSTRPHELQTD